ncbi:MAG: efflux RND transporter permease subunit [Thainema sp.]
MPSTPQSSFSISTLAIRRHIGTLMLTIAVFVMGFFFIQRLPVDLLPSITYPRIGVRADAPGVSPEVAIDEVTRPLEQALAATEGVEQVVSQTREGRISIDLYFQPGGNIDQALNDATATLNRARNSLPDTVGQPRLFKFDPSQLPVYELALTSETLQGVDLRVFADEELARELSTVVGVASVDVSGGVEEEVCINIDPQRLQAVGVGLTDVLNALEERNQDTAGGRIQGDNEEPLTRIVGRFGDADELRNLIFEVDSTDDGSARQVYLRDFAEVVDGTAEQRIFVNLNGTPAVKVSVQKQPGANTVSVVDGVKRKLEELRNSGLIPADVLLNATLDESVFIQNSIQNVTTAGLTGAGLAAIAVLLFLGSLRQTLIIVLAIPIASLIAVILMGIFGLSLNVFSLGGLAMGVGIVVDNSIVMLENIAKKTEDLVLRSSGKRGGEELGNGEAVNGYANGNHGSNGNGNGNGLSAVNHGSGNGNGYSGTHGINGLNGRGSQPVLSRRQLVHQAEQGSRELESALLASTSTNLVAVLPFLLIGGFIALLFNELILTISFSVAASMVAALTVVPALASRLLGIRRTSGVKNFAPIRQFDLRLKGLTRYYGQVLGWVLHHKLIVLAIAFLMLGGSSFWMIQNIPQEILPEISTGQASLRASFPPGTTLEENRKVMNAIDDILIAQPETEYVFSTSGGYLFASITSENALRGSSTITLKPGTDVAAFSDRMTAELAKLNLVQTRLRVSPDDVRGLILNNSPVRGADVDVILQSANIPDLEAAGAQVLAALEENAILATYLPDADPPQAEIQIRPDWERAADLGLSAQDIGETVQTLLNGSVPTQLQRDDRLVDIRVQTPESLVNNPAQLRQVPLFADDGQFVRLGDVATIENGQAPGEIQRINQRQVLILEGRLVEGATLGDALAEVDRILADVELPAGVTRLPSYAAASNSQIQGAVGILGGLAAFLVFTVMAVQYNSLIDPLVIMLTVPLALAGGILGLFITQTAIGATVVVGAVLLVGIVVNNAIIMVELANQIHAETGCDRTSAILQASPQRLRPILMTTVTTVLGLFPLALGLGEGSEFLQPMGIVVFSGLSLATLLTLFIIPCFYVLLHSLVPGDDDESSLTESERDPLLRDVFQP